VLGNLAAGIPLRDENTDVKIKIKRPSKKQNLSFYTN
jgi:hypothetical protein